MKKIAIRQQMKTVIYDPIKGISIPDGKVREFAKALPDFIIVSNSIAIDAIRVEVRRGTYKPDEIDLQFNGQSLKINSTGRLNVWPEDFCETQSTLLSELFD